MDKVKVNISLDVACIKPELTYLFKLLGINKKTNFEIIVSDDRNEYSIGSTPENTFTISKHFIKGELATSLLNEDGYFESDNGKPDYLATAFFCLNSLQEHDDGDPDSLGRFQYKNSYQYKFGNVKKNVVQKCFDHISEKINIQTLPSRSTFFLSHDIDTVYGAIKEDGFNVLKKGRFDLFLKMLLNIAMGKPEWLNIDKIMKLESAYDCRSTFYWIMNKGNIDEAQKNADYDFHSPQIQSHFKNVEATGFENSIHKSLSNDSFPEEIEKFGLKPIGNRYHYLKFTLPNAYDAIESAGLKLDASLGFSEQWGFRNNYGLPFNPYNFTKRTPYSFVEVPLNVMDRTFFNKRMELKNVEHEIFNFFEDNKENAVLSVLWHNNFFTEYKYKGYLSLYKKILAYIKEGDFSTINQKEIVQKYKIATCP